jgi:hypothetical protein
MHVRLTLNHVDGLCDVEDRVFEFVRGLEATCEHLRTCDIYVEGIDHKSRTECLVRVGLHVLGEHIDITGTSDHGGEAQPLVAALRDAALKAVAALSAVASCHCAHCTAVSCAA